MNGPFGPAIFCLLCSCCAALWAIVFILDQIRDAVA